MPTHQLLLGFTRWGMTDLGMEISDLLDLLAGKGFAIIEADTDTWMDVVFAEAVAARGLIPVVQCYPMKPDDLADPLDVGRTVGARFINAHAASPHLSQADAIDFLNGCYTFAKGGGVPVIFETHRDRITQDLFRTAALARSVPRLRFNLDVSHYILSGEAPGPDARLWPHIEIIMDRAVMLHGRVCNGQQIQVGLDMATEPVLVLHKAFWTEAMRRWKRRAPPGSALIFTPELGPVPYAPVGPDGNELTNRLEESLRLAEMARECWAEAV